MLPREMGELVPAEYDKLVPRHGDVVADLYGTAPVYARGGRRKSSARHGREGLSASRWMIRPRVMDAAARRLSRAAALPVRGRSSVTSLSLVVHSGFWRLETANPDECPGGKYTRLVPHLFFYERLVLRQVLFGLGVGLSARESPCRSMHIDASFVYHTYST
jgi:hypothetical protein